MLEDNNADAAFTYVVRNIYDTVYQESKEIEEGSPVNNVVVSNYRLRRAERWKNIPRLSAEVGEI